jgi:uncharacterized Zn finger protein
MTTATIPSRTSSQQYIVTLHDDGSTSCTCKAGQFGKGCWHQAALKAEALRRQSFEVVSLRTGRQYGTYSTLDEATAARDEIGRNGGWAGCYRLA